MLVLSRKLNESIVIEGGITVTVVEVRGNRVKLGVTARPEIGVWREEIARQIEADINAEVSRPPAEGVAT